MVTHGSHEELYELYQVEKAAYHEYVAEQNGNPVRSTDLKNRRIVPSRVAAAKQRWENAITALRRAGGTPQVVRAMLQERGERAG